jgi:hypothetical protein
MTAAALAFVLAVVFWGSERAGALGVVVSLGLTAALLFWLSGRWGGEDAGATGGAKTVGPD